MTNLQQWYPFFWACICVLTCLVVVMLSILDDEIQTSRRRKAWKLRDKLFFAMRDSA